MSSLLGAPPRASSWDCRTLCPAKDGTPRHDPRRAPTASRTAPWEGLVEVEPSVPHAEDRAVTVGRVRSRLGDP